MSVEYKIIKESAKGYGLSKQELSELGEQGWIMCGVGFRPEIQVGTLIYYFYKVI